MKPFDIKKFLTENRELNNPIAEQQDPSSIANEILEILTWSGIESGDFKKISALLSSMPGVSLDSELDPSEMG